MPQVDLETLVCGGGSDRKIACETLIDDHQPPGKSDLQETPPDYPAESFWLSKDAEFDWFDRNAFYERKESTKGNSTSFSKSNSTSQRFSLNLKSKASIIGLPKTQKTTYADARFRKNCKTANARFFPKRPERAGKPTVLVTEPSSPKVSCMGRVRSKRDKNRCKIHRQSSKKSPAKTKTKTTTTKTTTTTTNSRRKIGVWASFKSIFRSGCRDSRAVDPEEISFESPARKSVTSERKISVSEQSIEPPRLSGLTRFASGRRSESWCGGSDVDVGEEVVVEIVASEHDSVWRRRAVGPLKEVDCGRNTVDVGPASV